MSMATYEESGLSGQPPYLESFGAGDLPAGWYLRHIPDERSAQRAVQVFSGSADRPDFHWSNDQPIDYRRIDEYYADNWIRKMALEQHMIEPFADSQGARGCISYGVSSYATTSAWRTNSRSLPAVFDRGRSKNFDPNRWWITKVEV